MLELIHPSQFLKALNSELSIRDLTELQVNCLMKVLAKSDLANHIILNEFALIMENFGVPILDHTLDSDEEDIYIPEGEDKPRTYDLEQIDPEGREILRVVACYLLREYMHPREFFAKIIKNGEPIKTS